MIAAKQAAEETQVQKTQELEYYKEIQYQYQL